MQSLLVAALLLLAPPIDRRPPVHSVALPYAGPLLVEYSPAGGQWVIGFPNAAAGYSLACEWVGFSFHSTLAEGPLPMTACDVFARVGSGSVRFTDDVLTIEIRVSDAEAYRIDASAAGFDGMRFQVGGGDGPTPGTPGGPGIDQCPGGSCSCTGPIGPASACCPSGFSPACRCTTTVSSGVCTQVRPPGPGVNGSTPAPGVRGAVPDFTVLTSQRLDGGVWVDSLFDVTPADCD